MRIGGAGETFSTTSGLAAATKPTDLITTTRGGGGDSWRSTNRYNGTFANTNWVFTTVYRPTTGSTHVIRTRMRVWRSESIDGSNATAITASVQVGTSTAAMSSTTTDYTSTVTWAPGGTITLNNEYLFFEHEIEIVTAGGANGADVQVRYGPTQFVTPDFTAGSFVAGDVKSTWAVGLTDVANPSVLTLQEGSGVIVAGDLIAVVSSEQTNLTASGVTDNLGNTYTAQNAGTDAGNVAGRLFYSIVTVAGTLTAINVAGTASTQNAAYTATVFQGNCVAIDTNSANISNDITSPLSCPATGTLQAAGELVISWIAMNAASGVDAVPDSSTNLAVRCVDAGNTVCQAAIGYSLSPSTATVTPSYTVGVAPSVSVLGTASFLFGGSGTLSATEAADTISAAGALALQATLAATEAADTLTSAAGDRTATLASTEAGDTLSSTATPLVPAAPRVYVSWVRITVAQSTGGAGTLSKTEDADTLSSAAAIALQATAAITESADTVSSAAALAIQASASVTEAADTLSSAAALAIQATLSSTEATDTLSSAAALAIQATLAATEAADTLSSDGSSTTSVSVNITGVAATGAAGTPTVSGKSNTSVTGVAATGAAGTPTVAAAANTSVTGVAATGASGTPTVSGKSSTSVTGVAATGAADTPTVAANASTTVTGVVATGAAGTPTVIAAANTSVTGVQATGSPGDVTVNTSSVVNVSANVTGVAATGAAGTPTVTGTANTSVTGVEATGAANTPTVSIGVAAAITGVEATGSAGTQTVAANATVSITGVAATGAAGSPTVSGNANTSVTGVAATGQVGTLTGDALIWLRPDADVTDGTWTGNDAGTNLFSYIDEATADDGDYIQSSLAPVNDTCEIGLGNPPDGSLDQPITIAYRYAREGTAPINLSVRLLQNTTEIAAWSHTGILDAFVTAEQTLTAPQYALISDFNDLRLEFTGDQP